MHPSNYQKRIRLTFVDDYFDEKWEDKVIFLCIIDCIKRLSMEKPGNFEKKWQSQFARISLFLFKTIDFPSETDTMKSKIQYLLCQ